MTEKTTASSASARLRELSWARSVWHDARESFAQRHRIWALQRQFFAALHAFDVATPKPKSWLVRNVNISIEHPDRRVRRMRHKRSIEREILLRDPKLDPRSERFARELAYWMHAFDEHEGIYAKLREALFQQAGRVPYTNEGIALVAETVRRELQAQGYENVRVNAWQDAAGFRFEARIPTGIDHVNIHGSITI